MKWGVRTYFQNKIFFFYKDDKLLKIVFWRSNLYQISTPTTFTVNELKTLKFSCKNNSNNSKNNNKKAKAKVPRFLLIFNSIKKL